ncbi:MAG: toll/interleukin-1 receptor domain-containing protein [Microbacteriaceae bacterium]|nr:MAG: toll/interleukin-1 receptor domain-containing protein [Microbacteriaceae bacterium]
MNISGVQQPPSSARATVFISHDTNDETLARWLKDQVEAAGHDAWVVEWDYQPGAHLTDKVKQHLRDSDAYIVLLTEDGYASPYVQQEAGYAAMSGKLAIALVEKGLAALPMGMFTDVEQVRFDRNDLAASTAAIATGLRNIGLRLRNPGPTPDAVQTPVFSLNLRIDAQLRLTPEQFLIGAVVLLAVGGLIYYAAKQGGPVI